MSAFQPYKRQADPFAGAPFEHVQKRVSPETCQHQQQQQRNDRRRSKEKKSNANREVLSKLSVVDLDEDDSKNEEIIEVISKGKSNFQTPVSLHKTTSKVNPFINAPFTVTKKSLKTNTLPRFDLNTSVDGGEDSLKPSVSVKPIIPAKPILKSPEVATLVGGSKPEIASKPVLISPKNLTRNLNCEINVIILFDSKSKYLCKSILNLKANLIKNLCNFKRSRVLAMIIMLILKTSRAF